MAKFILICFLNLCVLFGIAQKPIKMLNYNTRHGFEGNDELKKQYINWVKTIEPDIVTYQEMIGFNPENLSKFARLYGHSYSAIICKEKGFDVTHPLAITSKYPITNVKMALDSLWHGYLQAKVKDLNLFIVHLAPFTIKDRQKDLERIIAESKKPEISKNLIIVGDLNALARTDSAMYTQHHIDSLQQFEGKLEPKSGTPIVKNRMIYRNNLNNGKIDFSITDRLKKEGFIDAFWQINKRFKYSLPTKGEKSNAMPRRIDYVWINKNLAKRLIFADIIQNNITDNLSDHYPMVVSFKAK